MSSEDEASFASPVQPTQPGTVSGEAEGQLEKQKDAQQMNGVIYAWNKNPYISHYDFPALMAAVVEHTGVSGFRFPIRCEEEIERLEKAVRSEAYTRDNYIAFLRDLKVQDPNIPIRCIFQSVFYDEAVVNYNYNGRSITPGVKKRAMKVYCIFRNCFLAAWREFGLTDDMNRGMLMEIIESYAYLEEELLDIFYAMFFFHL